jgi:hypothetical protein
MMGAAPRRAFVYVLAAALVLVAGVYAVRLSLPDDPYSSVRVQEVPSAVAAEGAETERVQWDSSQGRGVMDVRGTDGEVRRYYMEGSGRNGMRVWGGGEVSEEDES